VNKQDQIDRYNFHKNTFGIKSSLISKLFEKSFFDTSINYVLEPNISIENDKIYADRMYIHYQDCENIKTNLSAAVNFIKNTEKIINIDRSLLNKALGEISDNIEVNVVSIIIGYDIRDTPTASRVKISFGLWKDSQVIHKIIDLHGEVEGVIPFFTRNRLLFMIDMTGDYGTRIKLYPVANWTNSVHKKAFSKNICRVINCARKTFVSFNQDMSRVLHFGVNAKSEKDILKLGLGRLFENKNFKIVFKKITEKYPIKIIGIHEKELDDGIGNKINIYY